MRGLLNIETDWDFCLKYKDKIFNCGDTIKIDSDELDKLEILGAFGSPRTKDTKCSEYIEGIQEIKSNPAKEFSNQGGNRGVSWTPLDVIGEYDPEDVCLIEYDDLYNHAKELERKLAEARELIEDAISEIVVSSSDESKYTVLELYERLELLKEKGNE